VLMNVYYGRHGEGFEVSVYLYHVKYVRVLVFFKGVSKSKSNQTLEGNSDCRIGV
jgi:hypothetical protein